MYLPYRRRAPRARGPTTILYQKQPLRHRLRLLRLPAVPGTDFDEEYTAFVQGSTPRCRTKRGSAGLHRGELRTRASLLLHTDGGGNGAIIYSYSASTRAQLYQAYRSYVLRAARNSRSTSPVPEGEDFVRLFLEDSGTATGIHTPPCGGLLRCCGIPARLVTGYMSLPHPTVESDHKDNAHAWVEVFPGRQRLAAY
jgi:hypothetical protein